MNDEWPRSKYSIKSVAHIKAIAKSEVPPNVIQQIANNMDNISDRSNNIKQIDKQTDMDQIDMGPNARLIDVNIDTEMQKLFDGGYRTLKKDKGTWGEYNQK